METSISQHEESHSNRNILKTKRFLGCLSLRGNHHSQFPLSSEHTTVSIHHHVFTGRKPILITNYYLLYTHPAYTSRNSILTNKSLHTDCLYFFQDICQFNLFFSSSITALPLHGCHILVCFATKRVVRGCHMKARYQHTPLNTIQPNHILSRKHQYSPL